MKIVLIAAMNNNRVIGKDGTIPWHIPEDLLRFKKLTLHQPVVMGRKTFESIGEPLPDRRNVVVSKNAVALNNVETFPSLESALSHLHNEKKVYIIGGGEIFQQTIDRADELIFTFVENEESGDTYFPPFAHLIGKKFLLSRSEDKIGYSFRQYIKTSN